MESLLNLGAIVGHLLIGIALFGLITGGVYSAWCGMTARPTSETSEISATRQSSVGESYINDAIEDIELAAFRVLRDPDTPRRIMECTRSLRVARERLTEQFGQKAFGSNSVEHDYDREFRRDWKTVCDVIEAKYGNAIMRKSLDLTGYRREHFG